VLTGRCYEDAGAPPFWPWVPVIRAYIRARDTATLAAELGGSAADVAAVVPEVRARLRDVGPPPQVSDAQARFRLFDVVTAAFLSAAAKRRSRLCSTTCTDPGASADA